MTESRVAIVTGAGTGIGQAIALKLAGSGIRTLVVGRRTEPLAETVARGPADNPILSLSADITDAADRERIVAMALERFGRIDILVNNAGVSSIEPLLSPLIWTTIARPAIWGRTSPPAAFVRRTTSGAYAGSRRVAMIAAQETGRSISFASAANSSTKRSGPQVASTTPTPRRPSSPARVQISDSAARRLGIGLP